MVEMMNNESSHWWWFDSHNKGSKRSPWLQSTLNELNEKTKAMLKLIEEDADSFAQRAEMYYKKRPELISIVEEFYRAHRSLAERYDLVKSDHGIRLLTTFGPPFIATKYHKPEKLTCVMDQTYNSYSEKLTSAIGQTDDRYLETSDTEEYAESEVDDPEQDVEIHMVNGNEILVDKEIKEDEHPEQEEEIQYDQETKQDVISSEVYDDEFMKLREEVKRLKEENKMQKDQLMQKDEEKREVIRQLSVSVGVLKDENLKLRKYIARNSPKKCSLLEFSKLKGRFLGKLFSGSPNSQAVVTTQQVE